MHGRDFLNLCSTNIFLYTTITGPAVVVVVQPPISLLGVYTPIPNNKQTNKNMIHPIATSAF